MVFILSFCLSINRKKLTNTDRACEAYVLHEKILRRHDFKNLFQCFCSLLSAYIVCPLRSNLMTGKSNKGTPRRTSFPVFKLRRAVFWQNRTQNLFINSPYLPQINGVLWLIRNSSLFSGGVGGGCSILFFFKVETKMKNLPPPPPLPLKKKK